MDERITWSPRIPPALLRRLYETDASGVPDPELCDDVGIRLFLRCQTIVRAHRGEVECPVCEAVFEVPSGGTGAPVHCPTAGCHWQTTRREYEQSWSKRRIWAGKAVEAFEEYHARYPRAREYREKIVLIDRLIHSFHWDIKENMPNRSAGNNLIEGNHEQVMALLDSLSGVDPRATASWRETAKVMMRRRKGGKQGPPEPAS